MDSLEKKDYVIMLMDCYKDLLTEKQNTYLSLYYEEDLSLSEIAIELNVSRNAVFDNLKRTIKILERYENKLHLLEKHKKRIELLDKIEEEEEKHNNIQDYLDMLRRI